MTSHKGKRPRDFFLTEEALSMALSVPMAAVRLLIQENIIPSMEHEGQKVYSLRIALAECEHRKRANFYQQTGREGASLWSFGCV